MDHVTTTGEPGQVGRVIIGQIHANDDEPIRLYYRKLPHHSKGSVYFAHENRIEGSDLFFKSGREHFLRTAPHDLMQRGAHHRSNIIGNCGMVIHRRILLGAS